MLQVLYCIERAPSSVFVAQQVDGTVQAPQSAHGLELGAGRQPMKPGLNSVRAK